MKITLVCKYFYPSKRVSGLSDFAYTLAESLAKKAEISVISAKKTEHEPNQILKSGFKIFKTTGNFPRSSAKIINKINPDLVWILSGVHNPNITPWYFLPIKLKTKAPVIIQQGTHFTHRLLPLTKKVWQQYDAIYATHPQITKTLNNKGLKAQTLTPGLNLNHPPGQKELDFSQIKIGYFSHLTPLKGIGLLIQTFKELNMPKVQLIIAGDGPLKDEVKSAVKSNKNIKFLGYLKKEKLLEELKKCHFVVLPYKSAKTVLGFSNIALEAMANAIPVIASNTAAFSSLIKNQKNGLLYKDEKGLKRQIQFLAKNPSQIKKLGIAARKTIQDNFDMKKLILGYLTAVENNLQKKQKIQNYYDDYSHSYDQERTGKYYSVINDLEFETIQPFLKAKKSLEIGCGTGIILKMADQKTKQAFGIDLSPGMVAVSKRKKLKAQTGSATQIPFPNQTFDISYSFKVLAHVPEIKKAILEISRVTKNGGYVVLEFYNPYSLKFVTNFIQHFMVRDNVYIRYDSLKKIKSYLPKNVKIEKVRGIRIITPFNFFFRVPVLAPIYRFLEKKLADSLLKYFGSYFVVTMKKAAK
ncbi:MAG TPA: glycosyltransferase [Patescibacteria group bacterium]|nr:glycosyltransferase [Patescibacteria group bacterium]